MVQTTRSKTTQRNIWAQLAVSACALLLPPMALGAAVYSMLPMREESAGHPVAGTPAEAQVAVPKFRIAAAEAWPINADSQPLAAADQLFSAASKPAPIADTRNSVSPASARQEPASKTAKDMARVLGPLPVRVTVVTPPAAASPPPSADVDSAPTGSIGAEPSRSTAAEAPAALLSPPQVLAVKVPPPQVLATQVPATDPPSAEVPPGPAPALTARKHVRLSYLRNLAGRNGARAEARVETRTARGSAPSQQAFSLKNWLQQLSTRQRNTGG